MYIKNIKLQNYRNYKSLDLNLGRKTTVLIGKNGAGKTNMISAMKQALSFIFRREKGTPQYDFIASLDQMIRSFGDTDARYEITERGVEYNYPVKSQTTMSLLPINHDGDMQDNPLCWEMLRENYTKGIKESYAKESNKFWQHFPNFENLPVIAFYSASFPHVTAVMGKKVKSMLDFGNALPNNYGFYKWDDVRDCNPIWKEVFSIRWRNVLVNHNEGDVAYVNAVSNCLMEFSKPLDNSVENKDIELRELTMKPLTKSGFEIVFDFANVGAMTFDSLPDGYGRIFSIVFDIANRSYSLNRHCNPEGIVFIDEIDTHLHPSFAQEILDRLRRSFPKLQFIVTTHSPLVLSNFKQDRDDNVVYNIYRDGENLPAVRKIEHSYGLDYNSLLTDLMGTTVRNSMLRQLIESYLYWKESEDDELMNSTLREIIDLVGEESRLINELRR